MTKSPSAFISTEKAFTRKASLAWATQHGPWAKSVYQGVTTGNTGDAVIAIDNLEAGPVCTEAGKSAQTLSNLAYRFGATRIAKNGKLKSDPDSSELVKAAVTLYDKSLARYIVATKKAAYSVIGSYPSPSQVTKDDQSSVFEEELNQATLAAGLASLRLAAGLHNSRMAALGYLVEAQHQGITEYTINAVLDGLTSDICLTLHGTSFSVEEGYSHITRVLSSGGPEDLKQTAPWVPRDAESLVRVSMMSSAELVANGWHVPPFHPHCRSYLDTKSSAENASSGRGSASTAQDLQTTLNIRPSILGTLPVGLILATAAATPQDAPPPVATSAFLPEINENTIRYIQSALQRGDDPLAVITALGITLETYNAIVALLDSI